MVRSAAFITVLALAFPAAAQTTTNCSSFGGTLTCDTAPNGFVALGNAIRQRRERKALAEEFVSDLRDGRCDAAQAIANQYGDANDRQMASACVSPERQAERATMAMVSEAVRQGQCGEAKRIALEANRLDLADQALRVCMPAPGQ